MLLGYPDEQVFLSKGYPREYRPIVASMSMVATAHTAQAHPDAFHARQGSRAAGGGQDGGLAELEHLEPPGVVHLHQEHAILHVDKPGMSGQGLAGNQLPFRKKRLVWISRKPAFFPKEVFQQLTDLLHGRKSPRATVRTRVSDVLNDSQLSSGRKVKKACS